MTDTEKLAAISAIFETKTEETVAGLKVTVSDHACHNLEGAIISIEHDGNRVTPATMKTLNYVAGQLGKIANILNL